MSISNLISIAILVSFLPGGFRYEDETGGKSYRVDIVRGRKEIGEPAFREAVKSILIMQFLDLKVNRAVPKDVKRIGPYSFRFEFHEDLDEMKTGVSGCLRNPPRVQVRYVAPDHFAEKYPFPSNPDQYQWVRCRDGGNQHVLVCTGHDSGFSLGGRPPVLRRDDAGNPYYSFHVRERSVDKLYEFKRKARDWIHRVALIVDGYVVRELEFKETIRCDRFFDGPEMGMSFEEQERLASALRNGGKRSGIRIALNRKYRRRK